MPRRGRPESSGRWPAHRQTSLRWKRSQGNARTHRSTTETGIAGRTAKRIATAISPRQRAGSTTRTASKPTAAHPPMAAIRIPAQLLSLARCLIDRRWRRIRGQEPDRLSGGIDRVDLLADVGRPLHVHAEPLVGAHQFRDGLLVLGGTLWRNEF